MNYIELWGYKIYENGTIIGLRGKEMIKKEQVRIKWEEKQEYRFVSYARFVYFAFNQDTFNFNDKTMVIRQKNGNKQDFSIDNLELVSKKMFSQGDNNALAKLTSEQVEEIKKTYMKYKDIRDGENDPYAKISYRKLADKYGVSHTAIAGIVKGLFRNADNYKL